MDLIIVIPCYNEANRLNKSKFFDFINKFPLVGLVFVDDGSRDKTLEILHEMERPFSHQIKVLHRKKNKGKAEAVRAGMQFVFDELSCKKIAYLDADLSTSLDECLLLSNLVENDIHFVFGSRILKIGHVIKRRWFRHYFGRIIAKIISRTLGVAVYDTQCGCKIFETSMAKKLFKDPFISRWLFDVELFHRMIQLYGKENMPKHTKEIPLKKWINSKDSKVKFTYFFKLWYDLYAITSYYSKK